MNELDKLEDIFNSIIPIDDGLLYSEEFKHSVFEIVEEYMNDNILTMMNEDFHETLVNDVFQLVICQFEDDLKFYNYEECENIVNDIICDYYQIVCNARTCDDDERNEHTIDNKNIKHHIETLKNKLTHLKSLPQPQQRTKEWYEYRYNLLTASNAYKAFMIGSEFNQLIYEKCQPLVVPSKTPQELEDVSCVPVNVDTTLHWGQKYEEVSIMIYQDMYNTKIEEFGCIPHPTISFLGASPDGINMDSNNPELYGRMLEIKNIVNRDITGIPKTEYWVQMQLQMEICDLPECDFLETRIKEYESEEQYLNDADKIATGKCVNNIENSVSYKGVIMHFSKNGKPIYKYSPLNIVGNELKKWEESTQKEMETESIVWIKNLYWYLEEYSCVLVLRNNLWFASALPLLKDAWTTIEKERIEGYEHRSPVKRTKKVDTKETDKPICLIRLNNENGNVVVNDGTITSCFEYNNIPIRIRTESIDETIKKINGK